MRWVVMLFFCFFFSSRRRHTRCSRDWSSDVCSSDLLASMEHGQSGITPMSQKMKNAAREFPPFVKGGKGGFFRGMTLEAGMNDGNARAAYNFKRDCIQNSLYGVDIDPGAVEIAKLRLWLSLVVDEDDFKEIKPLPNLDYKIVCGDSLSSV